MMLQYDTARLSKIRNDLEWVGCQIRDPGDESSEALRRWNGALHPRPALVAQCNTGAQVAAALYAANEASIPVSIHNGGQDWQGRSLRDDTLVLDISEMTDLAIDPVRQEAIIGGGVTARQLNDAVGSKQMAAVIGNDGAVGVAGLLLGGGYGPLMTRFGLACDNLLSAEVALTNGTVVTCDNDRHSDLFWALRGGGGNFGVVTSARIRLHQPDALFAGSVIFPWSYARSALAAYRDLMKRAPSELFGSAALTIGPGGGPVVVISLVWSGTVEDGEALIAEIAAVGTPVMVNGGVVPAHGLLAGTDGRLVQGRGYEVATRWFTTLPETAIEALIAGFDERSSPLSTIVLHHCHGAATNVAPDATAFGMREPHFTALIYAAWDPSDPAPAPHIAWARTVDDALRPSAVPGGYANLLPDAAKEQIAFAYGANGPRLGRVKTRYDPRGILAGIPLPTASRSN